MSRNDAHVGFALLGDYSITIKVRSRATYVQPLRTFLHFSTTPCACGLAGRVGSGHGCRVRTGPFNLSPNLQKKARFRIPLRRSPNPPCYRQRSDVSGPCTCGEAQKSDTVLAWPLTYELSHHLNDREPAQLVSMPASADGASPSHTKH